MATPPAKDPPKQRTDPPNEYPLEKAWGRLEKLAPLTDTGTARRIALPVDWRDVVILNKTVFRDEAVEEARVWKESYSSRVRARKKARAAAKSLTAGPPRLRARSKPKRTGPGR